jgi:hypothetical protein
VDESLRTPADEGNEGIRSYAGTFKTVCVRLCDGYSWPISFSTTPDYFARDKLACEQSCGMPAKLYVLPTPAGPGEEMRSLSGEPYSKLRTAYQYRVRYDAACTCRGQPWDATAMSRHKGYALAEETEKAARAAAAQVKGSRKARRLAAEAARSEVEATHAAKAADASAAAAVASAGPAPDTAPASADIDSMALTAGESERIEHTPIATAQVISEAERERLAEERENMEEAMRLGATDREGSRRISVPSYRSGPTPAWESRAMSGN